MAIESKRCEFIKKGKGGGATSEIECQTYLLGDLWVFGLVEALGCLIPVGADALAGQLNLVLVLLDDLAQAEVSDFHLAVVEDDVLWFQVVVDYLLLLVVQVLQPAQDLRYDQLGLLLSYLLVLLQVIVKVRPTAQLENGTEAVMVNLHRVVVLNHAPIVQLFVDFVLPQRMLNVVVFDLVVPTVIEMVNFAGDFTAILQVKRLVDLREATLAKNTQNEVLVVQNSEGLTAVDTTIF